MTHDQAMKVMERIMGNPTVKRFNHDSDEAWTLIKQKLRMLENENQRLVEQLMGDG